ncbi:MAG: sulfite exporter TauE/SafE family protein [Bacteroidales bacterium]
MIYHSTFEYVYLWLPLAGFVVGLIGSMVGGGGGFFFLPLLTLLFNVQPQIAVATSLSATIPICIVGSYGHYRHGNLDIRKGLTFAAAGVFGAIAGASLAKVMSAEHLKTSFGVYSIVIATHMLINNWRRIRAEANGTVLPAGSRMQKVFKCLFFGFLAGLITGTFGTSGNAPVMAGMFTMQMPLSMVLGTTLLVVSVNTISSFTAHFIVGEIDLTLVWFLTSGAVIGALAGPGLIARIRVNRADGAVRKWYALGMIAFGILMIIG